MPTIGELRFLNSHSLARKDESLHLATVSAFDIGYSSIKAVKLLSKLALISHLAPSSASGMMIRTQDPDHQVVGEGVQFHNHKLTSQIQRANDLCRAAEALVGPPCPSMDPHQEHMAQAPARPACTVLYQEDSVVAEACVDVESQPGEEWALDPLLVVAELMELLLHPHPRSDSKIHGCVYSEN